MTYEEFLGQVQDRAQLSSTEDAVTATRATLESLGEHLAGGRAHNLASQLPPEIGRFVTIGSVGTLFGGDRFNALEFFQRVAIHEGQDLPTATRDARAVLSVLRQAVSPGELRKTLSQLPRDMDRLFEEASETGVASNR